MDNSWRLNIIGPLNGLGPCSAWICCWTSTCAPHYTISMFCCCVQRLSYTLNLRANSPNPINRPNWTLIAVFSPFLRVSAQRLVVPLVKNVTSKVGCCAQLFLYLPFEQNHIALSKIASSLNYIYSKTSNPYPNKVTMLDVEQGLCEYQKYCKKFGIVPAPTRKSPRKHSQANLHKPRAHKTIKKQLN